MLLLTCPNDNYHPEYGHVPAAHLRRFHEAKLANAPTVTVWGTGTPRREFLAVIGNPANR